VVRLAGGEDAAKVGGLVRHPDQPEEEIPMFRFKHVIPTIAVTLATAALVTPAAQAKPVTGPQSAESSNAAAIAKAVHRTHRDLATSPTLGTSREVVHDTPLANPVEPWFVVTGRTTRISGGADWTFPVMGAIALGLIIMIVGDEILVRRRGHLVRQRGQLAT
jgi:hypothetical protein